MDALVALGSGASFVWSTVVLLAITRAQADGRLDLVKQYAGDFYFESAAMILALITVGKLLEAKSKGRTTDALKGLMAMAPQKATLIRDGKEVEVGIAEVRTGDIFAVRPGENIPVEASLWRACPPSTRPLSQERACPWTRRPVISFPLPL